MAEFYEGLILKSGNTQSKTHFQPVSLPVEAPRPGNNNRQKYYNAITSLDKSQPVDAYCAEIFFYNIGTSEVRINGIIPLLQFDYIAFSGNQNEEDQTRYMIVFTTAGDNNLVVIRKEFV